MKFIQWIIDLFKDERGVPSVKPVISVYCTFILVLCLIVNGINSKFAPSAMYIDALIVIIIAGMGSDTLDKFSFKNLNKPKNDETKTPDV